MDIGKICQIYNKIFKREMNPVVAEAIWKSLMSFRYLSDEFCMNTESVIQDLFKYESYDYLVFPCDVVELRHILRNNKTIQESSVFGYRFAQKYLSRYPVFLIINSKKIKDSICNYKSISLSNGELSLDGAILKIVVNQPVFKDVPNTVKKIVLEENSSIEFIVNNTIPGQSYVNPRLASKSVIKEAQMEEPEILLNEKEREIFSLIKRVNQELNLGIDFRVAGGWVRDKLLGKESDDIDIAVSKMPGIEIAQLISNYAKQNNIGNVGDAYSVSLEKSADPKEEVKDDQLLVGGLNIFDLKIEFVPMRVEVYDDNSRTPVVRRTDNVLEDVVRRDLTINAMYYNIMDGKIEDYVNGREDLNNMFLRTPNDPITTLTDDPLRSLRILRFHSKYPNSQIDPNIISALKTPEVHMAYIQKVHPNRASKEIKKMLGGENPVEATRLLFETGLYKPVFHIPEDWNEIGMDQQTPHHQLSLMEHTLSVMGNYSKLYDEMDRNLPEHLEAPENEKALMMLSTMLHDFGKMHPEIRRPKRNKQEPVLMEDGREQMQYVGHENVSSEFAQKIMTEMGFEPHEKKFVSTVVEYHMKPHSFDQSMSPKVMGKFLHDANKMYKHIMDHAEADSLSKGTLGEDEISAIREKKRNNLQNIQEYRSQMGDLIHKPVVDGNRIKEIVQNIDPEVAAKNATIEAKGYSRPVHFMTYLIDRLKEQQWQQKVMSPEAAEKWLVGATKNFGALWRQQLKNKQQPVQKQVQPIAQPPVLPVVQPEIQPPVIENNENGKISMGWYKKNKKAQTDFSTYTGLDNDIIKIKRDKEPPQGISGPPFIKDPVTNETHLNKVVNLPYKIKDKVRWRWGTVDSGNQLAKQQFGEIVNIKDNQLIIKWDGKKDLYRIPLNNTEFLARHIERIQ